MENIYNKLKILADSAKFDVSCSTSGVARKNNGKIGNSVEAGICHSWSADGRCISLLKVLFTNKCAYNCEYCINRRSGGGEKASFEPEELAELTIEFYKRNYIEGLFLSSAVEISPDYTSERILHCLKLLRQKYFFAGYIHAKIIPGTSKELVYQIGLVADRLSVNAELPSRESLSLLAPQKKPEDIFTPMKQITNTLIEQKALKGPGTMFKGQDLNTDLNYLNPNYEHSNRVLESPGGIEAAYKNTPTPIRTSKFAPAGQTTQMIIGAGKETDKDIIKVSEKIYHTFKTKRVYYSAYIPIVKSDVLPDPFDAPPLEREHRLYQADWLLRFYGFQANELLDDEHPNLDPNMDPKVSWALRNLNMFPMEINSVNMDQLLRIPGIGTVSALRILRQRKFARVSYDDLKKMGVVLKRAKHFLTCNGKYYGNKVFLPEKIENEILQINEGIQISMFDRSVSLNDRLSL